MQPPMSSDLRVNVRGVFGEPQGFVHFQKLGLVGHAKPPSRPRSWLLCNPFYVVNAAKSKVVQEDRQPLSKAGRFTMRFPSIFFALDPFRCRQNVIDMEAEDTINHVAVTLVLEHFKGWITITGQSG